MRVPAFIYASPTSPAIYASGTRAHVLRAEASTHWSVERLVTLDQSTIGSRNLSFFF